MSSIRPRFNIQQLKSLWWNGLRIDFRDRKPTIGRSRGAKAMWVGLGFNALVGGFICVMARDLPPWHRITVEFLMASCYASLSLVIEYQEIFLMPRDGDILYWRPISSRVLFVSRILHIITYVCLLQGSFMLGPLISTILWADGSMWLTASSFIASAFLNSCLTITTIVLGYSLLLRFLSSSKIKDVMIVVQLFLSIIVFVGYQFVPTAVVWLNAHPAYLTGLYFFPASWFASWPAAVGWGWSWGHGLALGGGLLVLVGPGALALRRLAPHYTEDLTGLDSMDGGEEVSERSWSVRLQRLIGRSFFRDTASRAGFDFLLAQLRGDRRLKMAVIPLLILPLVMIAIALVRGEAADPYVSGAAPGVWSGGSNATSGTSVFFAAYFLVLVSSSMQRALGTSHSWKASWVFYAAPMQCFPALHRGAHTAVLYFVTLPATLLLWLSLSILWHNPLHALAHIAVPFGLALLATPLSLLAETAFLFSREPARHESRRDYVILMISMIPAMALGSAQMFLRDYSLWFILAGALLFLASIVSWRVVERMGTSRALRNDFDG